MDDPKPVSDQDLLGELRVGNKHAFTVIYNKYHDNLFLYAFKLVEDEPEAADIVQEVFVYLWESRSKIHINQALLPYLYQCVRHRFLNLSDHRKVRARFAQHFQSFAKTNLHAVDSEIEEKELIGMLDRIVAKQSKKMGVVFSMKYQGFTNEEIAEKLHVSVKTVRNLSSEALKKIKHKIKPFYLLFFLLKIFFYYFF
ncbi:RNA polymerase sigma-70 factor [Olivibacter sitiensis]|uniref:RNA polymerase sigma-70 factor n=1 Tax=Olivibacter sitiensis TaxID=376470 RepID=UPI000407F9AD|nr:RNA polymerase sigma-70 factor [Olivibacter sitiensis]